MEPIGGQARRLWQAYEPIHAVVYFAPAVAEAATRLGLRGWWMGYFAGRFAPLGPVGPAPAAAMAFGFEPTMVARSLPDAWSRAAPAAVLEHRIAAAADVLRARISEGSEEAVAELADLLWTAVDGCHFDGRPLGAAWSGVERPADPFAATWVAASILREHRGDGHVLAAVAHGLSGLDNTVSFVASGAVARDRIQPHRGWTDEQWDASVARLRDGGFLDAAGVITEAGVRLRQEVEDLTDRLAASTVERLGDAGAERAFELAAPISRHLVDAGLIPVPNPIGVPRP